MVVVVVSKVTVVIYETGKYTTTSNYTVLLKKKARPLQYLQITPANLDQY